MNFTMRIYQDSYKVIWYYFNNITISNITLISKCGKFEPVCEHKGNQKKFGYAFKINGKFAKIAGSNSSPILCFKGDYIDIDVVNFPRFPVESQAYHVARNIMQNQSYDGNYKPYHYNNGFSELHFDILNLQP